MAKKTKKVVRVKKVAGKKPMRKRVSVKPESKMSRRGLVALMVGLAVVVGVMAYKSVSNQAVPLDVMVVEQPTSFAVADRFGDGKIDKGNWRVVKADKVEVKESNADNLNVVVPAGAVDSKARAGAVVFKDDVSAATDFVAAIRLYKPTVNGEGVGRAGVRFAGGEGEDAEGVSLYWEVGSGVSELVFSVKSGSADPRVQRVAVDGKQGQLVIKRTGAEYLAAYRMDNFDDDNPYEEIGEPVSSSAVAGGKIRLFANNAGKDNKYPRTVARFDSVKMKSNPKNSVMSDNFAGEGALEASMWGISTKGIPGNMSKANGNLVLNVPAASKPAQGEFVNNVVRATSVAEIAKDTRGVAVVEMFKPQLTGNGSGVVGLSFNSESDKNEESASVRWVVTGNSSRLVFVVRNAKGNVVERNSVSIPRGRNRLTLRLMHGDGVYRASYRLGPGLDDDTGFKALGSERNERLGAKGYFSVFATHQPAGSNAPEVKARLDSFRVSYY